MPTIARKYATILHPSITALVGGHYRYKQKAHALARFKHITDHFVLSKEQVQTSKDHPAVIFWIKGFALDEHELTEGYSGHFARMEIATLESGLFTLTATKVERPLAGHPQKKRPTSKHPNWGHPVMRAIKRAKPYATIEDAQSELDLLHLEFPEVSIPGQGKLYIIVYEKREGIKQPTHKMAIEIAVRPEGGFILTARDNVKQPKPLSKHHPDSREEVRPQAGDGNPGAFTAKVLLGKKRKRKNLGRPVTGMKPTNEA